MRPALIDARGQAGETVDMPVFFYIDPDFAEDPRVCCRHLTSAPL